MHPFPHRYQASSSGCPEGEVIVGSAGLKPLRTMPPPEFGGPGGHWSPESLLVGAMADCYLLSFRAVARAARRTRLTREFTVDGTLDREQGATRFTAFDLRAHLVVPEGTAPEIAERALHRAEEVCLISNSLSGRRSLETLVEIAPCEESIED
jgi:organic hydroperoxide reductase OsmC/OhrA